MLTFSDKYEALERKFCKRAQKDRDEFGLCSRFLRNIRPEGPVDFVLVAKEPSLSGGGLGKEDSNFSQSIEDFILHYCVREYLCEGAETYYLTDLSKGAMSVKDAGKDPLPRYYRWYPLLEEELRLVTKPGKTRIIAIGNDARDFLTAKNLCCSRICDRIEGVMHYSRVAAPHIEKAIQCWKDGFPKFSETVKMDDIVKTAISVWEKIELPQSEIDRRVKQLQRGSRLTESRKKRMFYYKNRFKELRTASHIILDTMQA